MPMFPKRALIAIATTAFALALMFSFKTPEVTVNIARGGVQATPGDQGVGRGSQPTPTNGGSRSTGGTGSNGGAGSNGGNGGTGSNGGTGAGSSPATTVKGTGTLTGQDVRTRFGDVQVQVTLKNGKITDVLALLLPTHGRSGSISQAVEPMLHDETLQAQSAQIDIVSGATYTSEAYAQSLQSALDQAHG